MGNVLEICNQTDVTPAVIGDAQQQGNKYQSAVKSSIFLEEEITTLEHTDEIFKSEINKLSEKQQFREFLANKSIIQNKQQQVLYIGDLDGRIKKGKGVLYKHAEFFYHGDFDTTVNGEGTLKLYQQRMICDGHFVNGKLQGECSVVDVDGRYSFKGTVIDSKPHNGFLLITNEDDHLKSYKIIFKDYPNQPAEIEYNDGSKYRGGISLINFSPEGRGQITYHNGSHYSGSWQNGVFNGKGKFTWPDKSVYQGNYFHGIKQGHGIFTFKSKKVYNGQWLNGKQEGEGTLYSDKGQVEKIGTWKKGQFVHPE